MLVDAARLDDRPMGLARPIWTFAPCGAPVIGGFAERPIQTFAPCGAPVIGGFAERPIQTFAPCGAPVIGRIHEQAAVFGVAS
ncbi:hypothetical protein [Paracraurococcus ruber]|uniref:hypothetical protein n=1 Tax=Paracraurococcus ruber TaxID=77675 RepID=UPI0018653E60|nr:hypothetical protein [Paracraurococcus ruber]